MPDIEHWWRLVRRDGAPIWSQEYPDDGINADVFGPYVHAYANHQAADEGAVAALLDALNRIADNGSPDPLAHRLIAQDALVDHANRQRSVKCAP